MNPILRSHIEEIKSLCKRQKVKRLYTFGSINTSSFDVTSDLDFLVSFEKIELLDYADYYFTLCEGLEGITGRKVDLVTENSLENPYFIDSVEKTKELIYE